MGTVVPGMTSEQLLLAAAIDRGRVKLPEHYITTDQYARDNGISEPTAIRDFHDLMENHGWIGVKVNIDGAMRWAIWKKDQEQEPEESEDG